MYVNNMLTSKIARKLSSKYESLKESAALSKNNASNLRMQARIAKTITAPRGKAKTHNATLFIELRELDGDIESARTASARMIDDPIATGFHHGVLDCCGVPEA